MTSPRTAEPSLPGDAHLQLWLDGGVPAGDGTPRDVGIYASAVRWDPYNVNYNNFGGTPGVNFGVETGPLLATQAGIVWPGTGGRYVTWDLPATQVQSWINTPAATFGLVVRNLATTAERDLIFSSLEGDHDPRLTFDVATRPGDFNNDASIDASDVDLLLSQPQGSVPPGNPLFDVNADGLIVTDIFAPNSDVTFWVQGLAHTNYGDTDFDGKVIFDDLLGLAMNYGNQFTGWGRGNFDGRNGVDFNDLLLLVQHYGQIVALDTNTLPAGFAADWALAQSLVPEPTATMAFASGVLLVGRRGRRATT